MWAGLIGPDEAHTSSMNESRFIRSKGILAGPILDSVRQYLEGMLFETYHLLQFYQVVDLV